MGALLFISFDDLMMDFAKDNDLHEWMILVASHEIGGSLRLRSELFNGDMGIRYESKYDNIEFVNSIRPSATVMEHMSGDKGTFMSLYTSHLISAEPFMDLCSIVDMIVTSDCKVMIVMAGYECATNIPAFLKEFIEDEFDIKGYLYKDLLRLSENYSNKALYQKIVNTTDFYVPETFTGRNFDVIITNYCDDIEAVKEKLELQKVVASGMNADPGEENDLKSIFFNRFTESLRDKLKSLLLKRTDNDIRDMCRTYRVRISPNSTKDLLVEKLLHAMKVDVAREVEYQDVN